MPDWLGVLFDGSPACWWCWFNLLIAFIWLRRHGDLNRGHREPVLRESRSGAEPGSLPPLTVLVAAKDEQDNIGRCLGGLLAQDYPRLQVIAINDRSTDRTAAILDDFAARDPRLTAIHVRELPAGWFGKNHAMHCGVARASGDWLCFTDADCSYDSRQLLASALRFAMVEKAEFLSVLPRLEAESFWERVVQPVAGAIMVFWFPPHRVNDPVSSIAYANGAFMLLSRGAYERLGGHEPVRATLNEDMHLARRAKQLGVRLRVIRGGDLYRVRMYTGLRAIWRGWSRIFYGCFGTLPRLIGSCCLLIFMSLSPYASLVGSGLAGNRTVAVALTAGAALLAQQSVMWRFYPLTYLSSVWALTYPLGALLCLAMTFNAMTRLGGGRTTWRGTEYTGGARQVDGERPRADNTLTSPGPNPESEPQQVAPQPNLRR